MITTVKLTGFIENFEIKVSEKGITERAIEREIRNERKAIRSFLSGKDFHKHLLDKIENAKWLGQIFEHFTNQNNNSQRTTEKTIEETFKAFPYFWNPQKSKIIINKISEPIAEDPEESDFGNSTLPTFVISIPLHNPSRKKIRTIVEKIEDEAFGTSAEDSNRRVRNRVAVVIGLNTFISLDSTHNEQFKTRVEQVRSRSLERPFARNISLRIIPFQWGHQWLLKQQQVVPELSIEEQDPTTRKYSHLEKSRFRHSINNGRIHDAFLCYMLANSYYQFFRSDSSFFRRRDYKKFLAINPSSCLVPHELFRTNGTPKEKAIPYQKIRDTILHSLSLRRLLELCNDSQMRYVLSLDSDFSSLKPSEESTGLLSTYHRLIRKHNNPDVISTGYIAPESEKNGLIKKGIELDRRIRAAIPGKFVYMTEPNFIFRIVDTTDLLKRRLSWSRSGDSTMHTESRRLIQNGTEKGILDSSTFIYEDVGGVQTEIDDAWRTDTVNRYKKLKSDSFSEESLQKAIRGLHQSYADPQIWAMNVYTAIGITVSKYMQEAIRPIKEIRELFDPITITNRRYAAVNLNLQRRHYILSLFERYTEVMKKFSLNQYSIDEAKKHFLSEIKTSNKKNMRNWKVFIEKQLENLEKQKELLEKNYKNRQIQEIIDAAIASGNAIKDFYSENLMEVESF